MSIVPHPFLFRFSMPVRKVTGLPKTGTKLLGLSDDCTLPDFSQLDSTKRYGIVRAAWNPAGIGFSVHVTGKAHPPTVDPRHPADSDGFQVWIDTRNTQSIHRASRFCHHFCVLPAGGGKKKTDPIVRQIPIARARDETNMADPDAIPLRSTITKNGYQLEVWFPAEVLNGFDPEANPRLGFYYSLKDAELGEQFLSVGREFPFAHDPSIWSTLELTA
jgi:hypothetical protein